MEKCTVKFNFQGSLYWAENLDAEAWTRFSEEMARVAKVLQKFEDLDWDVENVDENHGSYHYEATSFFDTLEEAQEELLDVSVDLVDDYAMVYFKDTEYELKAVVNADEDALKALEA